MTDDRIVRDSEATAITGLSKSRRHELARLGKFPRKIKLSERASGYRHSDLMRWLESLPSAGGDAPATSRQKRKEQHRRKSG